ncbi:MAG: hypothetical protein BRC26_03900 [Nanohaloarchaea archaeon QH_8_44_6]|nr:MAG: hypothetical protein BRC26_03900 [Nanohaloarchaea archaeon QH_8_44_6]
MVRVENDTVREVAHDLNEDVDIYNFVIQFLKEYSFSNKRIVLDSSIDRIHDEIIPIYKNKINPCFTVKMPVPEDFEVRAKERSGQNWKSWVENKNRYLEHKRKAEENLEFDFQFGEDGGTKALLDELDEKLR